MLPTNVMSFMKKMVATEEGAPTTTTDSQSAGTFGKLRQTLSSSLLTAQDKVTKMSPRPSLVPDTEPEPSSTSPSPVPAPTPPPTTKSDTRDPSKPPSRAGACRVCLKSFKPDDFSKTCKECQQRVCEDCASYSKLDDNQDPEEWRCSVCRRKLASRAAAAQPQGSTDSLLEVPMAETLARRHSDVKLGVNSPSGLAPPRSPELRRHSDVSPASLKELEKLKGGSQAMKGSTADFMKGSTADLEWRGRGGRSGACSRSNSPPRSTNLGLGASPGANPPTSIAGAGSRRGSRVVPRQRSCDDEMNSNAPGTPPESSLGLPAPMPRRASAYDVFAPGLLASGATNNSTSVPGGPPSRRASFRVAPDDEPCSPDRPPTLLVDEDRRLRRRGSQLPDITALVSRGALPAVRAPGATGPVSDAPCPSSPPLPTRQQSVDGEAIRIVIHDVDGAGAAKRRVVLRKDPADKAHRTRGFGMRVVGGKVGPDGRLFAYIVWTVPGGPAEKGGLQQGDKVLEWGGVPLTDRSFEEVCSVMDRTGDVVELLVEHATDLRMCDLLEEPRRLDPPVQPTGLGIEPDTDKTPSSPTRRKLPKTPEQIARAKQVSGRTQLQVWYHGERKELVVALMAADELAPRDDSLGYGSLPEAYAQLRLLPNQDDSGVMQTVVAPASQSPIWNATLTFTGISGAELAGRNLQVMLWDLCPQNEPIFMGECTVDLEKAFLDDCAVWYRLEDPRGLRGASASGKSPNISPRGSLSGATPGPRRGEFAGQRSTSDDVDSIGECTSLLHPDHAWAAGSRRGSSQSETLEVEVYQLGKDFSRSLPGSRRSSFQQQQEKEAMGSGELEVPSPVYRPERRRSSVARHRDPDEILRNLKQVRGELGRTMSLSGKQSRRSSRVKGDVGLNLGEESPPELGPGQIAPRGRMPIGRAQAKLALQMTKGQLELEVICAKNVVTDDYDILPDTYVKCYLRDGERWILKKKTKVIRHSTEPQYNQTLKYQASEVLGRSLIVMVWQRAGALEHNVALGGCEISLERLPTKPATPAWYPLFPVQQRATDSSDSP